jgi:hypothetical protein
MAPIWRSVVDDQSGHRAHNACLRLPFNGRFQFCDDADAVSNTTLGRISANAKALLEARNGT